MLTVVTWQEMPSHRNGVDCEIVQLAEFKVTLFFLSVSAKTKHEIELCLTYKVQSGLLILAG
jgi:hypothetical protein